MELNFNSVETIPGLNASAAFFSPTLERLKGQVDSGKVFKEDVDMVPTIIDKSLSYMPWGGDNMMPYNILKLIEDDEPSARQSLQHESPRQRWRADDKPLSDTLHPTHGAWRSYKAAALGRGGGTAGQRPERAVAVRHRGLHAKARCSVHRVPALRDLQTF